VCATCNLIKKKEKGGVMVFENTNLQMNKVKKASAHSQNILHGDTSMYNIKIKDYKTVCAEIILDRMVMIFYGICKFLFAMELDY
jgi:thioredoxin-related protein